MQWSVRGGNAADAAIIQLIVALLRCSPQDRTGILHLHVIDGSHEYLRAGCGEPRKRLRNQRDSCRTVGKSDFFQAFLNALTYVPSPSKACPNTQRTPPRRWRSSVAKTRNNLQKPLNSVSKASKTSLHLQCTEFRQRNKRSDRVPVQYQVVERAGTRFEKPTQLK